MNLKSIIVIAFIISAVLLAGRVSPAMNFEQYREGKYIHVDNIVMEFSGANATVDVEYHLSPLANAYIFLFGSKHLEPKIKEIFLKFPEVKIREIGLESATLQLTNISWKYGNDYMHNSTKLGLQPDILTVVFPYNQGTRKLQNPDSTLSVFYPDHPENQKNTTKKSNR
ncbi:hypothetical protein ASJ81_12070 [Methanosarcina spelaei]|uniref:Uncharacterized protein n=1 Tax=Methanosarcina spelaei TaxID=1036679 RepID=A0A2A2HND6_9EURY|nr:hypothetical protein [Methanosarcina spelaei]PAV10862.1 hypothetical protein ASJ81_12070 [Methanosarcina spelaei]